MAKVTVADRIKDGFEGARLQLVELPRQLEKLPRKAVGEVQKSIGEVQKTMDEVPAQLRGAWDHVVVRLRDMLDYASRDDLNELVEKVEELSKKVDKLIRGEKIRNAADKKPPKKG
jgi:hypothetical protein